MDNILACRICLVTDVKLYDMYKYRLKSVYENLTGLCMNDDLHHICIYCGTLLSKYAKFRQSCFRTQQVLELLLAEHLLISTDHVRSVNQKLPNLAHPYTVQYIDLHDSTIQIKDEVFEDRVKPDTNEDKTEDFEAYDDTSNISTIINLDEANKCSFEFEGDSDEEPLSIKVKKKHKTNDTIKLENEIVNNYDDDFISNDLLHNDRVGFETNSLDHYCVDESSNSSNHYDNNSDIDTKKTDRKRKSIDKPKKTDMYKLKKYVGKKQILINQEEIEHKLIILTKEEQIKEVTARRESSRYKNSVFKCEDCCKGFMMKASYRNHMIRHDPASGPVTCDICRMRWPDVRALRAHILMSHERKYICKICGHTNKTAHKAKEHVGWHRGAIFTCKLCEATFTKNTSFLTHMRLRHPTENVCKLCGMSFLGEKGLDMHRKKAHLVESDESAECQVCRIRFDDKDALIRHNELGCDANLSWCSKCGSHFSTADQLKVHLKTHEKRRIGCEECSRTFSEARLVAAHVSRVHRKQPPRAGGVCELCGLYCVSRASLINHQRTHSGEKPFACSVCSKRFRVLQLLQIHTRTHTGERPFPCTRCPKAFKHKAALNRHDRVHTGAKPYTCPQCGKSFSQSNSMKQHCAGVHMKTYLYSRRAANKQTG